jgi:NAD(P)H-dependent FMN reductase
MTTVLVVHHTPSPACQALLEAALAGLADEALGGLDVRVRPALTAGVADLLEADGVVLGTPANMGYMSGALKHFLDQAYYPALMATVGLPWGLWVHGQNGTTGAVRSVVQVAGALKWRDVAAPVEVIGEPSRDDLAACRDLAATVGAHAAGLL